MSRMRLLDTRTRSFRTVNDPRKVRYAILSHVWRKGPEGDPLEQTYLDVCQSQASATVGTIPALSEKLERFCDIAERGGCELAWADSCCIDKRSSSELSEAINSMYDWYRYADVCYVYLHDVFANSHREETEIQFVESEWHRRGWTLQELLAPRIVLFVSAEWQLIGSKLELAGLIQRATHIPRSVLTFERRVADCSVACRMSWAASRETTKVEDQAYSLLGIFGVNMPTTYGEGSYAFIRLQREILKNIHDQTIFAWGTVLERHSFSFFGRSVSTANLREDPFPVPDSSPQYLLAASPKEFEHSADFRPICWQQFLSRLGRSIEEPNPIYTATSSGIRTRLPLLPVIATDYQTNLPSHLAILACERDSNTEGTQLVAILLRPQSLASSTDFLASAVVARMADLLHTDRIQPDSHVPDVHRHHYRLAYITDRELTRVVAERVLSFEDVCVPYRPSQLSDDVARDASFHAALRQAKSFELFVCSWSKQLLALRGYNVRTSDYRQQATSRTGSPTVITIIGRAGKQYNIKICHCGCRFGSSQYYLSVTVSSIGARGVPRYHGPGLPASGSHHSMDDPSHVYSWNYGNGVASQKFELQPIPQRELVTMQLTISRVSHESPASSECTRYALGIEIWDGCGEYLQALPSSKCGPYPAPDGRYDSPPISADNSLESDAPDVYRAGGRSLGYGHVPPVPKRNGRYYTTSHSPHRPLHDGEVGQRLRPQTVIDHYRDHTQDDHRVRSVSAHERIVARQNSSKAAPVTVSEEEYAMGYSDFFNEPEGLLPFMSAGDEEFMEPPPPFQHEYDNGKHPRQPNGATQVIAQPPSGQRRGNKDGRTQVTRSPERSATLLYRTPVNGTTHDGYHALEGAEVVSATAAPPAAKIGISTVGQQNVVLPGRPPARSPLLQQFDGSGAVALDYNSKDIDGHDSSDARAVPPQVPQLRSPDPPRSNSNPAAANVHATHATSGNQMPDTLHHTSTCGSQLGQGRQATSKGVSSGFGSFKQLSARLSASAAAVFNLRRGRSCE